MLHHGVWGRMDLVQIVYVTELPEKVMIRVGDILLVGTNRKGVESNERLCSQEGKQMELHYRYWA